MTARQGRPRVYVRRRYSDKRWQVSFDRGAADVYNTWPEAIRAATALGRARHPLPRLTLADRRANIPGEYDHLRGFGMSHQAACDRLARIYGVRSETIARYSRRTTAEAAA